MAGTWQMFVDDKPWNGTRKLYIRTRGPDRKQYAIETLGAVEVERGEARDVPALSQSVEDKQDGIGDVDHFLQAALECAWELGLRPKGFADHSNELTAVRYHLEDMRLLAKVKT